MRSFLNASFALLVLGAIPCLAMIDVGHLSREEAAKLGITMKQRPDGDAGVRVWLEFKLEGFLEKFTYAELRVENASGKHLVSARLEPHPVVHGQSKDLLSVAFSADPSQLAQCSFMIVAYGSSRGDVGYVLKVKEFLDLDGVILAAPPPAKVKVGETAPVVDALLSDGSPLDPKDLAGKVVLLTFWSADDSARERQFEALRVIRREFRADDRLRIVSVRLDGEWAAWLDFCRQPLDPTMGPNPSFDCDPTWWQVFHTPHAEGPRNLFVAGSGPEAYLIGMDGKVAAARLAAGELRGAVARALDAGR